jgi:hypothetical protein
MAIVPIPPASASVAALALPASGVPVMRSMRCCWANDHGGMAIEADDAADDEVEEDAEDADDPLGNDAADAIEGGNGAVDAPDAEAEAEIETEAVATASGGVARSSARCSTASSAKYAAVPTIETANPR